jgi:hypothetical protein
VNTRAWFGLLLGVIALAGAACVPGATPTPAIPTRPPPTLTPTLPPSVNAASVEMALEGTVYAPFHHNYCWTKGQTQAQDEQGDQDAPPPRPQPGVVSCHQTGTRKTEMIPYTSMQPITLNVRAETLPPVARVTLFDSLGNVLDERRFDSQSSIEWTPIAIGRGIYTLEFYGGWPEEQAYISAIWALEYADATATPESPP